MNKKNFIYEMRLMFDAPIWGSDWRLMCVPAPDDRQYIADLRVEIQPATRIYRDTDGFGNLILYGHNEEPHTEFSVRVEGTAYTGIHAYETTGNFTDTVLFRNPSALTRPGDALRAYLAGFPFAFGTKYPEGQNGGDAQRLETRTRPQNLSNYDRAVVMMEQLHEDMAYTPGATTIDTTAEEAITLRRGVCQDYAHILIALCRMLKIPARYVVGMIEGEGASHAWVEVFSDGLWYGIDPTNRGFVVDDYVKISHGRDYRDCVVNKGKFYGGAKQHQTVKVLVT